MLKLLSLLLFVAYHLAHLGLRRHTLALGLKYLFLLLEIEEPKEWGGELQEGQERLAEAGRDKEGVKAMQGS